MRGKAGMLSANTSKAWNVAAMSYLVNFSVVSQDVAPVSLAFKSDGTRMYVVGSDGDDVNEYSLSSAWDVSTASYVQAFSVSAQDALPLDIAFKPDGTRMYLIGGTGDDVNEYSLSSAWDVSTASYVQAFSVSAQDTVPRGLAFSDDGSRMYVSGDVGRDVNEYSLSSAWDVSTASYVQAFSFVAQDTQSRSIAFKPDGTRMYIIGGTGNDVNEYSLSSAWDVSTASYVQAFSVSAQDAGPSGLAFKPDGTRMYLTGLNGDRVYQYDISS